MKKKGWFICFGLLLMNTLIAQNANYIKYHTEINKAEEEFFLKKNVDSSLYYYDKVFLEYDFIFLKDVLSAMQIAFFSNRAYEKYLQIGFEQGLKISNLNYFPVFNPIYSKLEYDKNLQKSYLKKRKKYLKKIDYIYLDWTYDFAVQDQLDKYLPEKKYNSILERKLRILKDSIVTRGFPGDRLLGVSDNNIFAELKLFEYSDIKQRVIGKKRAEGIINDHVNQFFSYEIIPFLLHHNCSCYKLKDILIDQIKKGNIHPADVALLNDWGYRYKKHLPYYCEGASFKGIYTTSFGYKTIDTKISNLLRKEIYMVSYEIDSIKKEYEYKYGFVLFSRFQNYKLD